MFNKYSLVVLPYSGCFDGIIINKTIYTLLKQRARARAKRRTTNFRFLCFLASSVARLGVDEAQRLRQNDIYRERERESERRVEITHMNNIRIGTHTQAHAYTHMYNHIKCY